LDPMGTANPEIEAKMAEIKASPPNVRRVIPLALTLGALTFCTFAASAVTQRMTWFAAIATGLLQLGMYSVLASATIAERKIWAWILLILITFAHSFFATGSLMRLLRLGLSNPMPEVLFDLLAIARLGLGVALLVVLLSADVRHRIFPRGGRNV